MVRLWPGEDERSCCSPGALQRARQVAHGLGLPFHVVAGEDEFATHVVEPFVHGYLEGETPNPCIACNPRRLAALIRLADTLGLARVATGHYARLIWRQGQPYLRRSADGSKDQTYMLWAVPPELLARLEFPLGELAKPAVREAARMAGLPVATQPESQEVCFAPDGYRRFLEARGVQSRAGSIVDREGRRLGGHAGQWRYTIGQRRGLGVSATEPLYVLERRAAANEVVVGRSGELETDVIVVTRIVDRDLREGDGLVVQLRYRSAPVAVSRLERLPGNSALVRLAEPFSAPAPGQAAVFYRDEVVVGGAVLASLSGGVERV